MREIMTLLEAAPLVVHVFHGTNSGFKKFDDRKLGSANGTAQINMTGFNFTDSREVAETFGKNIIQATLTFSKPYVLDAKGKNYSQYKATLNAKLDKLDHSKYDGIVIKNYGDAGPHGEDYIISTHYIPFDNSQISITDI